MAEMVLYLEDAGAEVVSLPLPVTPAARVVMAALPITGCVVSTAAEVEWIDGERGGQGWSDGIVNWCVGPDAARRAKQLGWKNVRELAEDSNQSEMVASIAG
jgi:hypothetical protein